MSRLKIKERPELTDKFPAMDGIRKNWVGYGECYSPAQEPIRSDVIQILGLSSNDFKEWYNSRRTVLDKLIKDYKVVSSIPHLMYGGEKQQYTLGSESAIGKHLETLERGLEYLEVIRKVYEEQRDD